MYEVKTTFIQDGEPRIIYDYFRSYSRAVEYAFHNYDKAYCENSVVYKNGSFVIGAREFTDYMYEKMEDEING